MDAAKKTRNRNPSFPALDLGTALERAESLHRKEAHKSMMAETAAKHWGSNLKSSFALQSISSLKQYGLLVDEKVGGMRKVRLSDLALKIILDKRGTDDRLEALREAALLPKIHAELWAMADDSLLASDEEMEHYLTLGRKQRFFPDVVKRVIERFKSSVAVAELEYRDIMDEDGYGKPPSAVKVGDLVQWTSNGMGQFLSPQPVTGISEDGEWAFVAASGTGMHVSELTIEKKAVKPAPPPTNPDFGRLPQESGTKEFPLYLSGGLRALLRVPEKMTAEDFELLTTQIESSMSITKLTSIFDRDEGGDDESEN